VVRKVVAKTGKKVPASRVRGAP